MVSGLLGQLHIQFVEEITTAIEQKKYAVGIFLDLKKAFDTVELHKYGIRGTALSWLNSYLYNRQHYVELQNHNSKLKKITCGVPQGSVLILFADTNLICSGENLEQLLEIGRAHV